MKRIKVLLFVLLGLLMVACGGKSVKVEYNFEAGQEYKQEIVISSTIKQGEQAQDTMKTEMKFSNKYTVKNVGENIDIEAVYDNISMGVEAQGQKMLFSSNSEKINNPQDMEGLMSLFIKNMTNAPFNIIIGKSGNVVEVKNTDNLFAKLFEGVPELSPADKISLKQQLDSSFGKDAFASILKDVMMEYPKEKLKVGKKWKAISDVKSKLPIEGSIEYTVTEITDTTCTIEGKGTMAQTAESKNEVFADIKGDVVEKYIIDLKTGWIKEGTVTQNINGTLDKIPNAQMTNVITIKG